MVSFNKPEEPVNHAMKLMKTMTKRARAYFDDMKSQDYEIDLQTCIMYAMCEELMVVCDELKILKKEVKKLNE